MILDATTKSLEIVLAGAVTTNQLPVVSAWTDITAVAFTPGETDAATNDTTEVTIVEAPAAATQRQVKEILVFNADTVAATVRIRYNNNTTIRQLTNVTLDPGESLVYKEGMGWMTLDTDGSIKGAGGIAQAYVDSCDTSVVAIASEATSSVVTGPLSSAASNAVQASSMASSAGIQGSSAVSSALTGPVSVADSKAIQASSMASSVGIQGSSAVSSALTGVISSANSSTVSQASAAVSSVLTGPVSVADSKAESVDTQHDSKDTSQSTLIATADSKGVQASSMASSAAIQGSSAVSSALTGPVSKADSKAESAVTKSDSADTVQNTAITTADSKAESASTRASSVQVNVANESSSRVAADNTLDTKAESASTRASSVSLSASTGISNALVSVSQVSVSYAGTSSTVSSVVTVEGAESQVVGSALAVASVVSSACASKASGSIPSLVKSMLDNTGGGTLSSWSPTVVAGSGTPATVTTLGRYTQRGQIVFCYFKLTITDKGTATGAMQITNLPVNSDQSTLGQLPGFAREGGATGKLCQIFIAGVNTGQLQDYTGADNLWVDGYIIYGNFVYFTA